MFVDSNSLRLTKDSRPATSQEVVQEALSATAEYYSAFGRRTSREEIAEDLTESAPMPPTGILPNDCAPETKKFFRRFAAQHSNLFCYYCGATPDHWWSGAIAPGAEEMHKDHIVPHSAGGPSTDENLIAACGWCNQRKSDSSVESFRRRMKRKFDVSQDPEFFGELPEARRALGIDVDVQTTGFPEGKSLLPDSEHGALEIPAYHITADGEVRRLEEASGVQYCLAGLYRKETGRDIRPARLKLIFPPQRGLTSEIRKDLTDEQARFAQLIPDLREGRNLENRQRSFVRCLAKAFARYGFGEDLLDQARTYYGDERGKCTYDAAGTVARELPLDEIDRLPVACEPEQRKLPVDDRWFHEWTLTLMDAEEVLRFTEDAGRWHYLSTLISEVGTEPETNAPDYRKWPYVALTPEELSPVTELLGLGSYYDFEEDKPIGDGRSPILLPHWPDKEYQALDHQIRVATDVHEQPTAAKGVGQTIKPEAIEGALGKYSEMGRDDRSRYQEAAEILRSALSRDRPTILLVRGDQIKIGCDCASARGQALIAGTNLRGTLETESDGRPRPQFDRYSGNQQLTQFLTEEGHEHLRDFARQEIENVASKCQTLEGIAQIVSETTNGRPRENQDAYADFLKDAITGGGIRMKSADDWIQRLKGDTGELVTTAQVRRRLASSTASYLSHWLRHFCIEGRAHLHLGCASDQSLLKKVWTGPAGHSPLADPSAVMHPRKASKLLGADDDGDIVGGMAANTDLSGVMAKVVMLWRFPQVDVPAFMAFPEDFYTPWDGRTEQEQNRFRRVIEIFAPNEIPEEPSLEDKEVTLLEASEAYRLSGTGAREAIDAEPVSKDASEKAAWDMVERKRKLNQMGSLTHDLERLGDLMAKADASPQHARNSGCDKVAETYENAFNEVRSEAGKTSLSIELTAVKYKKATEREVERPSFRWRLLDSPDGRAARRRMPIDYPDELKSVDSLLKEYPEQYSICLEDWEGPRGESRHAVLIRGLIQNSVQKVVQAFERIKVDRQPLLNVMRKKKKAYLENFEEKQLQIEKKRIRREADTVCTACRFFRDIWRNLRKNGKCFEQEADDKTAARKKMKNRRYRVSRELKEFMEQISQTLSPMGLAEGVRRDWGKEGSGHNRRWDNTTAAGMRLLAGRTGEVFLPQKISTEPLESEEQYAVVFTTGRQNAIPIDRIGETCRVKSMHTRSDDGERVGEVTLEDGAEFTAHFDSDDEAPPRDVCEAVEKGEAVARVTRTTRSQGLLRWKTYSEDRAPFDHDPLSQRESKHSEIIERR